MVADPKHEQLVKIARLYYLEEMNQRDIARKMNMSLAGVSRSISRAREQGIVTISVNGSGDLAAEREIRLEKQFKLRECLIVDTSASAEVMYTEMAAKLSGCLDRILVPESRIGVSWGFTLKTIGEHLPVRTASCRAVVPIVGAIGRIETGVFPNSIARSFAEKLGCDAYLVNTPGLVDSGDVRKSLMDDSSFKAVADLWRDLDVALFSVSGMNKGDSVRDMDVLPASDLTDAGRDGAVMVANFLFYDNLGRPVSTGLSRRIINIDQTTMTSIPHRIIVAAGAQKVEPLRAALRGHLPHVLVTDMATAESLLAGND